MTLQVSLHHTTVYRYDRLVQLGPQKIRLRPAPHCRTPVLSYSLRIEPGEHFINWQQDRQSNFLTHVVIPDKIREFSVTVDLVAEMAVINPFDFFVEESAGEWPFVYEPWLRGFPRADGSFQTMGSRLRERRSDPHCGGCARRS